MKLPRTKMAESFVKKKFPIETKQKTNSHTSNVEKKWVFDTGEKKKNLLIHK